MRAMRYLALLLLLAACDPADPVPDPPPEATPAATPEATPAATPAATPLPTPEATPALRAPYHRASARKGTSTYDAFTFWGWSADGHFYAFETFDPGPGATECEGRYDLFIIDARSDKYADGGHVRLQHEEPEPASGVCSPKDLASAWPSKRDGALKKAGIVRGALRGPVTYQAVDEGGLWEVATPTGPIQVSFAVDTPGREGVMSSPGAGAAYTLKVRRTGEWIVVEPGTRRRETVHNYALLDAFAFFSPSGAHAALFVSRTHLSFEGDRITFMSNGIPVP